MTVNRVVSVYYSATGCTAKVSSEVAGRLASSIGVPLDTADVSMPASRSTGLRFGPEDLVVLSSPTYRGRLPAIIVDFFRDSVRGDGTNAVAVVTFGNRCFDNSLAEMVAILRGNGFLPIAGAAFSCRHAYTDRLGAGRPDEADLADARAFADRVAAMASGDTSGTLDVPGSADAPYFTPVGLDGMPVDFQSAKPVTDMGRCVSCGRCADLCPLGSVDRYDFFEVVGQCFKCQACVRGCPVGAKSFEDPGLISHTAQLERDFADRKENSFFFARG